MIPPKREEQFSGGGELHTSDKEKQILLSEEVQSLILKGAIERVQDPFQSPGFYSRIFLVLKKTGGMRPVIDLSILNTFLLVPHFKMETNRSIRSCIHPGMWITSLDLMDAYFHILIAPPFRQFLRYVWDNNSIPISNTPIQDLNGSPSLHKRVIFKKMKTLCDIEGEISNWTNCHNFVRKIMSI